MALAADYIARQPAINRRRRVLRPMMRGVGGALCRVAITGRENIPNTGAVILMTNHISFIDPIVYSAIVRNRFVISMAKVETLDNPFFRQIVRLWGNFVVNRDEIDRTALNIALGLLENGHCVLIAPEGTRNPQGLQFARSGTAYIAHKSGALILPAAICGAQDWHQRIRSLRRAYARVHFGRPFRLVLPPGERFVRATRDHMMREAMYQLARTIPDEYADHRGVYGDLSQATARYVQPADMLGAQPNFAR